MKALPNNIVIVGGGSAGWMTACYLARAAELSGSLSSSLQKQHEQKGHQSVSPCSMTLLESSSIPTVGVGEGSTPYLRHFFAYLGVEESTWMEACNATYKMGINFEAWNKSDDSCAPKATSYFHPFFSALDVPTAEHYFSAVNKRRHGQLGDISESHYFTAAEMVKQNIAPNSIVDSANVDYAYHFDAGLLGEFLKRYATSKGVIHKVGNVVDVHAHGDNIEAIQTDSHGVLHADLFIDCSGFRGILGKKALNRLVTSYADTLFNDAAVAIPTKRSDTIKYQTRSIALKYGWQWNIPLTARTGNGYVYSSRFCTSVQAEQELRSVLDAENTPNNSASGSPARHLKMEVGRLNTHWAGNCLSVGLSQGFIEPLEATALMLVQYALHHFIDCWQQPIPDTRKHAIYNNEMNRMFDGIRDYIAAHYYLNTRTDTPYWVACRNEMKVPDTLAYLLKEWDSGANFEDALNEVDANLVYLRPSWYCIFAGMKRFSTLKHDSARNKAAATINPQQMVKDMLLKMQKPNTRTY